MRVKFFEPGLTYEKLKKELDEVWERVMTNGDLIMRHDLEFFEKRLADFVGTKYAVGVNSGTDALYIALRSAGIKEGDEVIVPSHTFIASIEAVVRCGATPVLVDIDENWLLDLDQVSQNINSRTKAIIPVHLSGDVVNLNALKGILNFKDRKDIIIIEDAAQALGAKWEHEIAGSVGLAGCFSFYPAKILGCAGDGGAITTNSEEIYKKAKLLRNHYDIRQTSLESGATPPVIEWTGNSRLDNLQAAILNVKLDHLEETLERRKEIAEKYNAQLQGLPLIIPPINSEGRVWQDYVIRVPNLRRQLKEYLNQHEIEVLGCDQIPNHKYRGLGLEDYSLPLTEQYVSHEFMRLPCNENLTDEQVDFVIQTIKTFYGTVIL